MLQTMREKDVAVEAAATENMWRMVLLCAKLTGIALVISIVISVGAGAGEEIESSIEIVSTSAPIAQRQSNRIVSDRFSVQIRMGA